MAVKRGGLGKGLDKMIPEKETKPVNSTNRNDSVEDAVYLDINKVEPNRDQPRKNFSEDELMELSDSIKQYGIISPLLVQKRKDYYEIIAGERRWRAAKMAGLTKIPVIIKNYSELEIMEISLIENIQREDLNPIEEALAYKRLLTEFDLKQDEVAEKVSKSRTAVTNALRLLKLNDKVQQMVIDGLISTGHARALLGIDNQEKQYTIALKIFDERLSVRDTEKLIKNINNEKKKNSSERKQLSPQLKAVYHDLEEQLKGLVGTKVSIAAKDDKTGKIEIEYFSPEELDRIIDLLRAVSK